MRIKELREILSNLEAARRHLSDAMHTLNFAVTRNSGRHLKKDSLAFSVLREAYEDLGPLIADFVERNSTHEEVARGFDV